MSLLNFTSITKIGAQSWRYAWTASGNVDIYLDGRLIEYNYSGTTYDYDSNGVDAPSLEVVDTGTSPDTALYPSCLQLQWYGVEGASYYRVEQKVSGTWTTKTNILEDGRGYFQYTTGELEDSSTQEWRITPVDEYDGDGEILAFDIGFVRIPPMPAVTISWDNVTHSATVRARA